MDIKRETELIRNYIVNLRKHFHMYPELGMQEYETSKRIREELRNMEIPFITAGETGVIGILGRGDRVIALRADMDALMIQEQNDVGYKSKNDGIMHACAHDAHMAALLGAASILKKHESELKCTIKLIFQPSEENCKGAKMIVEGGHLDHVDMIFGLHVFGDMECGKISIQPGPRMAISDLFRIELTGKSGHAGKPHQCSDTTVAAAALTMNLQAVVSREINPVDTAVLSIGKLVSGTQHNIISGKAVLEGTVRSFSVETSRYLEEALKRMTYHTALTYNCTGNVDYTRSAHPAVINDEDVTQIAGLAASKLFRPDQLVTVPKIMLGEDFSIYQMRVPGTFAFVGGGNAELGRAYPNHHEKFNIDEKAVSNATQLYAGFAMEANNY